MWADNMITQADSTSLKLGVGKAAACYCAVQIRRNKSPVPSPPVAPRRMRQSCSSMTCHKHEGKHTHTQQHTPERQESLLLPLGIYSTTTDGISRSFYRAIKWHVSSLPSYFLTFRCDRTGSICTSVLGFFVTDRFTSAMHRQFSWI